MREWGKYDPAIVQAIMRELPKTWGELWNSPTLRAHVKSKLTLAAYLKYLKQKHTVKRVVDDHDKVVYMARDALPAAEFRTSQIKWATLLELRRWDYDIEELYWGGQELGLDGWWKAVQERAKKADSAMKRAVSLWFNAEYGDAFRQNDVAIILGQMTEQLIVDWFFLIRFYLPAIFGDEASHLRAGNIAMAPSAKTRRKAERMRRMWLSYWYQNDPEARSWDSMREYLALLALGIKAGHYTIRELQAAIEQASIRLAKRGLIPRGRVKGMPFGIVQADDIHHLSTDLYGNDPKGKARAEEILGLTKSGDRND
jgi:hypothetical protein